MSKIRILFGNVGSVTDPHSASGTAFCLCRVLQKHFSLSGNIDASFGRWGKWYNTLLAFHPNPTVWRERRSKSISTFVRRGRIAQRQAESFSGKYDFYLQQRALFSPIEWLETPFGFTADVTHRNTLESWPPWNPLGEKECSEWLRHEQEIYDRADILFPRSHYTARSMIEEYGQSPDKVVVVGSGINFLEIPPPHGPFDHRTLLFIGYDFERKGGQDLLTAFDAVHKKIPTTRLVIVGPRTIGRKIPEGVEFLGKIRDRKKIASLYQEASVFVMPSLFEPWGNVYLEAMAHGVPCVGCCWGAIPEVIEDGVTGRLVERSNPGDLTRVLLELLSEPAKLQKMGSAAREKVLSEFAWDKIVERMKPHIERVVG